LVQSKIVTDAQHSRIRQKMANGFWVKRNPSMAGDEGLALRRRPAGVASNRLMLRWLMTVVVSDEGKAHVMRQVGIGKASVSEPLRKRRNNQDDIGTGEFKSLRDEPGGPLVGQAVNSMACQFRF